MQNKRTGLLIVFAVIIIIIVVVYGLLGSVSKHKNPIETEEDRMNKEILLGLRSASSEADLSSKEKAAILTSLRSPALQGTTTKKK